MRDTVKMYFLYATKVVKINNPKFKLRIRILFGSKNLVDFVDLCGAKTLVDELSDDTRESLA